MRLVTSAFTSAPDVVRVTVNTTDYWAYAIQAQLVARFVTMLADGNPRFSPSRFREACEGCDA
jgi:hypothetical protein